MPWRIDERVRAYLDALPNLALQPWNVPASRASWEWVPVPLLRWIQTGIDSRMMFAHDAEESGSVYETTDQLWREVIKTRDITPEREALHAKARQRCGNSCAPGA